MDNRQFDSLTRAMAVGTSRRALLKLLAGGAAAGGVAVVARDVALAECHGIACSSEDDCCAGAPECSGGVCVVAMSAPDPAPESEDTSSVDTMPNSGAGPLESRSQAWLAAVAAGGAAAWLALRLGRTSENEADESA